ncbi:MAG: disulfide bond formation protein DsbB [Phenylobacterium sp.]|jgi:disulfide bond formation protein DsbB
MLVLAQWTTKRSPWILLGLSALIIEVVALYFQYGMKLEPCIMCIYQRLGIIGIILAGFVTAIAPQLMLMRLVGFTTWAVSAIWGMMIAIEHVGIQTETDPFVFATCESVPNFPSWMPLHQWIPDLFEARGDCGDINWRFFDYSMPQWMIVVFAVYTALFATVFLVRLAAQKKI